MMIPAPTILSVSDHKNEKYEFAWLKIQTWFIIFFKFIFVTASTVFFFFKKKNSYKNVMTELKLLQI